MSKIEELIKSLEQFKEVLEKRAPKGVDPEKHERCVIDVKDKRHDVGSAHAICTSSMKKDELDDKVKVEMCKFNGGGQWSIEKSNYGPKGAGLYNPLHNQERKAKNTGDVVADAGRNVNVKRYTTSGSSVQAAHEAAAAKEQKIKTKASTRTFANMSEEEKAEMKAKYEKPLAKGADVVQEVLLTGNLPIMVQAKPQPTNEEMFGHLVKTQKEIDAAEARYQSGNKSVVEELSKPVDHLNKSKIDTSWGYGQSFNSLLKDKLTDKEIAERNAYTGE